METIEIDGKEYHAEWVEYFSEEGEYTYLIPIRNEDGEPIEVWRCICAARDKFECCCGAYDRPTPEE